MKNDTRLKAALLLGFTLLGATGCERELSEDAELAIYPQTAEIFIDGFSGGLNYFPFQGATPEAFQVDTDVFFDGTASMRFDVPNDGEGYVGATFPDLGGRNLTDFDAMTFWAKATKAATINEIGFGLFEQDPYRVTRTNLPIGTSWKKYIIPIPDPSKLTFERGVFWLAEGAENGDGYTFWIDELKYETLGTIAQPRPAINGGVDQTVTSFTGATVNLTGLTQTFNLGSGDDVTVTAAPAFFDFTLSNDSVATINELGELQIIGDGTVTVTAVLNGVVADGSLTILSVGDFAGAPVPTRNPADVLSIFSNAYTGVSNLNVAVFNNSEIVVNLLEIGGDQIIDYSNLAFVGLGWDGTEDVSGYGFLHVDIQVTQDFASSDAVTVELIDFGGNASDGGGDDTGGGFDISGSSLVKDGWVSVDIPINSFTNGTGGGFLGSPNLTNIARVVFVGKGISNILVDNIYFYR